MRGFSSKSHYVANLAGDSNIDTNLYSRQIGTLGLEAMGKLIQLRVLIIGLRGLGIEIAKNIVLAGPKSVTIVDDQICTFSDMGANFYISESNVSKGDTRSGACIKKLECLNDYVSISVYNGTITEEIILEHDVVVCSDIPLREQLLYNSYCRLRTPSVKFISANSLGLCGSIFVDFGPEFCVFDSTGEEPKSAIIANISKGSSPTTVTCLAEKILPFQDGDYVTFREIQGMLELNGSGPYKITVTGKHQFTIDVDTNDLSPYLREGIVTQVKVPNILKFRSLAESMQNPLCDDQDMLIVPDLTKFGRSEQLFFAIYAVMQYGDIHGHRPSHEDINAIQECIKIANDLNNDAKERAAAHDTSIKCNIITVDSIDTQIVTSVCKYSRSCISPMAAFLGGIAAQEIVKSVGKYMPLRQYFLFDAFEILNMHNCELETFICQTNDFTLLNSRYDDQIAIFGRSFQSILGSLHVFLVGAGALGCEYLKSMALMGVGCGNGLVTITDMDNIEVSNLNRQFLFRQYHVGSSKSLVAEQVIKEINANFNVESMQTRVGTETEDAFDDNFWHKLNFVVNALDNVPSRMYINDRCLWFEKPLLESGTLGTKANSETYLPHRTQSYADNRDPAEESIPLCTLKHFPHAIEHTIEWSRDAFQGIFTDNPKETITFLQDPENYFSRLKSEVNPNVLFEKTEKICELIKCVLQINNHPTHEDCIKRAILLFNDYFYLQIRQLLTNFPSNHLSSDGSPFWSGPKRCPIPQQFDVKDPLHFSFVLATANLFAFILKLPHITDDDIIYKASQNMVLPEFVPKNIFIEVDDSDRAEHKESNNTDNNANMAQNESIRIEVNMKFLSTLSKDAIMKCLQIIQPIEFEKDDDTNFHIAFINASANLRARNYSILECDHHKCKMIAGRIIPAMATTTAMITGLVSFEILKVASRTSRKIEDFKNSFINLSLPLFVITEPLPPPQTKSKNYDPIVGGPVKAKPEGFTAWDKIVISYPNGTIEDIINYLRKSMQLEVQILSLGNVCLYNAYMPSHSNRKTVPISSLAEQLTKKPLPINRNYLALEASCCDTEDGTDVIIPTIKFTFK
ncbi:ubiquitin-activating enzyme E1 family protein [Cryptosporidium serpentis]